MNELAILKPDSMETLYIARQPDTPEEKKAVANAMSNPTHKLADFVNTPITVSNIFMEKIVMDQQKTVRDDEGNELTVTEPNETIRTILIDQDGISYSTLSVGVINALKHFFLIFGTPDTWEEPKTMIPKNVQVGKGKLITLEIA